MMDPTASGWARRAWVVFTKEIRDHTRDRRSLTLALIYPLLAPLLVAGGLFLAAKTLQGDFRQQFVTIPVAGMEHAPDLEAYLKDNHVLVAPAPPTRAEMEDAVRDGHLPVVMIVPESAQGAESFTVEFITNTSRVDNLRITLRLSYIIRDYNRQIAQRHARAAGLPDDYGSAVKVERTNVSREANIAVFFYNMMPPLVIFMIFLGGVHLAIDTTVGERERGSLEPLLLAPVERWVLLLAKAFAAFAFTAVTAVVNLTAFRLFMGLAVSDFQQLAPPPDWDVFVRTFFIALPLMAIAVALQMSIAVITRSMKEAQIYLGLLPLVPALPGMMMVFAPMTPTDMTAAVPILGQLLLINQLVVGQNLDALQVVIATVSTTAAAALIFALAAKWFRREKMFVLG